MMPFLSYEEDQHQIDKILAEASNPGVAGPIILCHRKGYKDIKVYVSSDRGNIQYDVCGAMVFDSYDEAKAIVKKIKSKSKYVGWEIIFWYDECYYHQPIDMYKEFRNRFPGSPRN